MKVRKNGIELSIPKADLQKYLRAGWQRKQERTPEKEREYYLNKLRKQGKLKDG